MRWKGRRGSSNVEDRRCLKAKGMAGGGIGTVAIVLIVLLLGGDSTSLIQNIQTTDQRTTTGYAETAEEKELAQFVSVVLAETESVWHSVVSDLGMNHREPQPVLQRL